MRARRSLAGWGLVVLGVVSVVLVTAPAARSSAQGGALQLSPRSVDFDDVDVDDAESADVSAKNTGPTPVTIERVRTDDSAFKITSDPCSGETLSTGMSCMMRVEFRPVEPGVVTAELAFETNAVDVSAGLTGRGIGPSSTSSTSGTSTVPTTSSTTAASTTTTGPRQTTTTTTAVSDLARLEQCDQQAATASVSFEPVRRMRLGETSQVRVVASLEDGGGPSITVPSTSTTIVDARLRCEVQARVRSQDFTVNPDGFQQGSFLDQPEITWSWDVVPLRTGSRLLTIEIRSVVEIDGRKIEGAGTHLFETKIKVDAEPENVWDTTKRWSEELVGHPLVQGLGPLLLLLGTVAGVWRRLLKRPWPWKPATPAAAPTPTETPPEDPEP